MRHAKLITGIGRKGIGKTHTTIQEIFQYVNGSAKAPPRKVLIFDINGEYTQFKTIDLDYLGVYSISKRVDVRRITAMKNDGSQLTSDELQQMLYRILKTYRHGLLVVEDPNKYLSDNISNDVIGMLATQRHVGVDVYVHFQTKGKAGHPKLFGMMTHIRLHKTNDSFERHKDKFKEDLEFLKLGETLVEQENKKLPIKKQWFHCYLDTEHSLITGQFSVNSFKQAVQSYILDNASQTVNPLMKQKNIQGRAKYPTWRDAVAFLEEDLFEKYFGNNVA